MKAKWAHWDHWEELQNPLKYIAQEAKAEQGEQGDSQTPRTRRSPKRRRSSWENLPQSYSEEGKQPQNSGRTTLRGQLVTPRWVRRGWGTIPTPSWVKRLSFSLRGGDKCEWVEAKVLILQRQW